MGKAFWEGQFDTGRDALKKQGVPIDYKREEFSLQERHIIAKKIEDCTSMNSLLDLLSGTMSTMICSDTIKITGGQLSSILKKMFSENEKPSLKTILERIEPLHDYLAAKIRVLIQKEDLYKEAEELDRMSDREILGDITEPWTRSSSGRPEGISKKDWEAALHTQEELLWAERIKKSTNFEELLLTLEHQVGEQRLESTNPTSSGTYVATYIRKKISDPEFFHDYVEKKDELLLRFTRVGGVREKVGALMDEYIETLQKLPSHKKTLFFSIFQKFAPTAEQLRKYSMTIDDQISLDSMKEVPITQTNTIVSNLNNSVKSNEKETVKRDTITTIDTMSSHNEKPTSPSTKEVIQALLNLTKKEVVTAIDQLQKDAQIGALEVGLGGPITAPELLSKRNNDVLRQEIRLENTSSVPSTVVEISKSSNGTQLQMNREPQTIKTQGSINKNMQPIKMSFDTAPISSLQPNTNIGSIKLGRDSNTIDITHTQNTVTIPTTTTTPVVVEEDAVEKEIPGEETIPSIDWDKIQEEFDVETKQIAEERKKREPNMLQKALLEAEIEYEKQNPTPTPPARSFNAEIQEVKTKINTLEISVVENEKKIKSLIETEKSIEVTLTKETSLSQTEKEETLKSIKQVRVALEASVKKAKSEIEVLKQKEKNINAEAMAAVVAQQSRLEATKQQIPNPQQNQSAVANTPELIPLPSKLDVFDKKIVAQTSISNVAKLLQTSAENFDYKNKQFGRGGRAKTGNEIGELLEKNVLNAQVGTLVDPSLFIPDDIIASHVINLMKQSPEWHEGADKYGMRVFEKIISQKKKEGDTENDPSATVIQDVESSEDSTGIVEQSPTMRTRAAKKAAESTTDKVVEQTGNKKGSFRSFWDGLLKTETRKTIAAVGRTTAALFSFKSILGGLGLWGASTQEPQMPPVAPQEKLTLTAKYENQANTTKKPAFTIEKPASQTETSTNSVAEKSTDDSVNTSEETPHEVDPIAQPYSTEDTSSENPINNGPYTVASLTPDAVAATEAETGLTPDAVPAEDPLTGGSYPSQPPTVDSVSVNEDNSGNNAVSLGYRFPNTDTVNTVPQTNETLPTTPEATVANMYFELNGTGSLQNINYKSQKTPQELEIISRRNAQIMNERNSYTGERVQIPAGFVQYFLQNNPDWSTKLNFERFGRKIISSQVSGRLDSQPHSTSAEFNDLNPEMTEVVSLPGYLALEMMQEIERSTNNQNN